MRSRIGLGILLAAIAVGLWWMTAPKPAKPPVAEPAVHVTPEPQTQTAPPAAAAPPSISTAPSAATPSAVTSPPAAQRTPAQTPPTLPAVRPPALTMSEAEAAAIETELQDVRDMVRDYRNSLGENPVGTNAEITQALLGDNRNQIKLSVPPGSSVNAKGELCDRWGTAYFFHQISGMEMEVHSAGPDREMWTGDDRVVK